MLLLLVLLPPHLLWVGFVIATMWGWFVAPFGLATPPLAAIIGVWLLIKVAFYFAPQEDFESSDTLIFARLISAFTQPAIYLGIGWVVHLFM